MRRLPTVSEMPRATACAASVALPRTPDTETSASALRGQRIHAWIAAKLRGWPLPDIGKTKVSHIDLDALRAYIGEGELLCEPAFSYNGTAVECLGENIGREYNRPGTLCGAADIVAAPFGGLLPLRLVDIKTGSLPVPAPRENWQLATLAVMAGAAFDPGSAVTGTIATLNRDGSWDFGEPHTWTLAELAAIRRRIDDARALWTEAHEAEESGWGATPTPGSHCRWCRCVCSANAFASEAA